MKNFLKIFIISLIISLMFVTVSLAAEKRVITSVAVTGIDAPYSEGREIDTTGIVPTRAPYRITDIAWQTPGSSTSEYYEVTVTLKANIGYAFSGDTIGTVNGEEIISKRLLKEDEISITYAFDENSSTAGTINSATSTIRYRITVYCNTEKGTITPTIVRVLEGNNQTFKIIPNQGYRIKDVVVDGESVGIVSEYTFKKVKEDHTIKAYFEKIEIDEDIKEEVIKPEITEIKPMLKLLIMLLGGNI